MKEFENTSESTVMADLYGDNSADYDNDGIELGREKYNPADEIDDPIYSKLYRDYENEQKHVKKLDKFFKLSYASNLRKGAKKATVAQLDHIKQASSDMLDMVLAADDKTFSQLVKYIGYAKAEYGIKVQKEKEQLYSHFPKDTIDRNMKVNYLSFMGTENGLHFKSINDFQDKLIAKINSDSKTRSSIIDKYEINLDSTMDDFAYECGFDDDEKNDFLKRYAAKAEDTVKTVFQKIIKRNMYRDMYYKNGAPSGDNPMDGYRYLNPETFDLERYNRLPDVSDETIMNMAVSAFVKELITSKVNAGIDEFARKHNINQNEVGKAKRSSLEASFDYKTSSISEWIVNEGKPLSNEIAEFTSVTLLSDEKKNDDKSVSYDQYIRLHAGYKSLQLKQDEVKENLAKSIAASILKKSGRKFSVDDIHTAAKSVKLMPEYKRIVESPANLKKNLANEDAVNKCMNNVINKTYGVENDKISEYVDRMANLDYYMEARGSQSTEYKNLKKAIKNIADIRQQIKTGADPASFSERITTLNTVLLGSIEVYMKGKKKVRKTEEGKCRFNNALDAMGLLAKFAPETKPQIMVTVNRINEVRETQVGWNDYVDISNYNDARAHSANDFRREREGVDVKERPSSTRSM
ncbi:MAG: hypothetical protein K5656_06865 [Lachnospiraceae bacterium]|nr:hypothetical protein [Lachnospiraceae bacterium]